MPPTQELRLARTGYRCCYYLITPLEISFIVASHRRLLGRGISSTGLIPDDVHVLA